ncbi:MAG TPA: DUF2809 domain-containing protein [Flavobacterium sp.]|uniref:ribosomal maturation YjgA family protein n=1 Tax=Flavobacterium sp. TaxID=239 RepID=UPI002B4B339B|nr:DUF2809 domain-containing protein [Flavobacterium sp.]HLO73176.1 DUF2809 domain-containing protein [Flavobacterium sp.]
MKSKRSVYFIVAILVVFVGLLSRKIIGISLFIGDILYAVLIYFGFRFLLIDSKKTTSLLLSLLFCFCIELFQLIQFDWLIAIRKTTLGHYILGQGFLLIDLICLVIGTIAAYFIDYYVLKINK